MHVYGLETIQIIQVLNNDVEDENFKEQSILYIKSHETYLKEEFPCIKKILTSTSEAKYIFPQR